MKTRDHAIGTSTYSRTQALSSMTHAVFMVISLYATYKKDTGVC